MTIACIFHVVKTVKSTNAASGGPNDILKNQHISSETSFVRAVQLSYKSSKTWSDTAVVEIWFRPEKNFVKVWVDRHVHPAQLPE